jgi:hypothetical protein
MHRHQRSDHVILELVLVDKACAKEAVPVCKKLPIISLGERKEERR